MNKYKLNLGIALVLLIISLILMITYDGFLLDFTFSAKSLGLNLSISVILLLISGLFFYRAYKFKHLDKKD